MWMKKFAQQTTRMHFPRANTRRHAGRPHGGAGVPHNVGGARAHEVKGYLVLPHSTAAAASLALCARVGGKRATGSAALAPNTVRSTHARARTGTANFRDSTHGPAIHGSARSPPPQRARGRRRPNVREPATVHCQRQHHPHPHRHHRAPVALRGVRRPSRLDAAARLHAEHGAQVAGRLAVHDLEAHAAAQLARELDGRAGLGVLELRDGVARVLAGKQANARERRESVRSAARARAHAPLAPSRPLLSPCRRSCGRAS